MAMKIGTAAFKERVSEGIDNEFMRGAVSGAQERLRTRRLQARNWETGRIGVPMRKKSDSMCWTILISIWNSSPKTSPTEAGMSFRRNGGRSVLLYPRCHPSENAKNRKIQIHGDRRNQYERSA